MSFNCKGHCEMNHFKRSQFIKGYANGQRYCRTCERYFVTDSFRCYCCHQVLRQSNRYHPKKYRENNSPSVSPHLTENIDSVENFRGET